MHSIMLTIHGLKYLFHQKKLKTNPSILILKSTNNIYKRIHDFIILWRFIVGFVGGAPSVNIRCHLIPHLQKCLWPCSSAPLHGYQHPRQGCPSRQRPRGDMPTSRSTTGSPSWEKWCHRVSFPLRIHVDMVYLPTFKIEMNHPCR